MAIKVHVLVCSMSYSLHNSISNRCTTVFKETFQYNSHTLTAAGQQGIHTLYVN